MKRQSSITPSQTTPIESLPSDPSQFYTLFTNALEERSRAFFSYTPSKTEAHLAMATDFNASRKIWDFGIWGQR